MYIRTMRHRLLLIRSATVFLAGAATSILVAWIVQVARVYRGVQEHSALSQWATVDKEHSTGEIALVDRAIGYRAYVLTWVGATQHQYSSRPTLAPPRWVARSIRAPQSFVKTAGFGLPLPCMKWEFGCVNGSQPSTEHALEVRLPGCSNLSSFPLTPILPNLLLNTLFYATLFSTPYLLRQNRRHLRLRRGHCPVCNYNLLNDFTKPCPECGSLTSIPPTSPSTPQP